MRAPGCWFPVIAVVVLLAACGPSEAPIAGSLDFPIINGELVPEGEHRAVVGLTVGNAGCTGTLISERVVLTAAHCVEDLEPEEIYIYFGNSLVSGYQRLTASEVVWHPNYRHHPIINDVGLIRLAQPAPEDVVPVPHLPSDLAITQADVGTDLTFVGFGLTSPQSPSNAFKYMMTTVLYSVCTQSGGCFPGERWTICIEQSPTGICSGDSGGPALIERDGQVYVGGVNSYTLGDCLWFGCGAKVDEFQDFIEDFLGAPGGSPCAEGSECESAECHDGYCCDVSCLGTCKACDLPGVEGTCSPVEEGTPCPDQNQCNGVESCLDGSCQGSDPLTCVDQIACTRDLCDPNEGCVFQPSTLECFDDNPCTEDKCDATLGCLNENLPEGQECDLDSHCLAGQCVPDPVEDCGCVFGVSPGGGLGLLALAGLLAVLRRRRPL